MIEKLVRTEQPDRFSAQYSESTRRNKEPNRLFVLKILRALVERCEATRNLGPRQTASDSVRQRQTNNYDLHASLIGTT